MDFDVILRDVGEFGRYQKLLVVFVILPACLPGGFHGFSQIFSTATPKSYSCRIPHAHIYNGSKQATEMLLPYSMADGKRQVDQCKMYDMDYESLFENPSENISADISDMHLNGSNIVDCKYGWNYDTSVYTSTIVTEWDLVCSKDLYPTVSIEIHTIGTFIGALCFGLLGDRFGRKTAFYIAAVLQFVSGLATAFSPNFILFCVIRFINGLTIVPIWIFPLIMGLELIGPTKRAPVGVTMSVFYTLGVVGLAGVSYLIRDWFYLQLAVTLPFSILLFWWWLLPESPRWLLSQGRFEEMMVIVQRIAKVNRVQLPPEYQHNLYEKFKASQEEKTKVRQYHLWDLFKTPNLRFKTCLVVFNSFSNYCVYNGLNFFVPHLGEEEQLSFLLSALVEVPSYIILYLTLNRLGRRVILMSSMVLAGIFCIVAATVASTANQVFIVLLFLLSKFCVTCSFFVTDLVASELFPTVVRGVGASLTQTVSALGLCISPIITHFAKHYLFVPLVIFGLLAVVGGASTLLLPETANTALPETLEEGEEFGKNMTWKDRLTLLPRRKSEIRSLSETRVLLNGTNGTFVPMADMNHKNGAA